MMIEDVETQLGSALRDLVPEPRPRAGLAELVETAARRNRRNRWSGAAAALGVLLVAGGLSVHGLADRPAPSGRTVATRQDPDGPLTPAPPAISTKQPHLALSPTTLPRSGGLITLTVVNPTDTDVTYGIIGNLFRWNGSAWMPYRKLFMGSTKPTAVAVLYPLTTNLAVAASGQGIMPRHSGNPTKMQLPALPSGYYRLTQDYYQGDKDSHGKGTQTRSRLSGIFVVPRSTPYRAVPPAVDPGRPHIALSPASVPRAGGVVNLTVVNPTATEVSFTYQGGLERWNGTAWTLYRFFYASAGGLSGGGLYDDPTTASLPEWARNGYSFGAPPYRSAIELHVPLPELQPGYYRFTLGLGKNGTESAGTAIGLLQVRP
jgi:hypothetical protein